MSTVNLTAPDQWDLIRLIALQQATDPRRPFKEILENALEHGSDAKNVLITINKRGRKGYVRIEDDGNGWTTLEKPNDARSRDLRKPNLSYSCSNIGNSIKARLEREHMEGRAVGRFGIGLLSFWALGKRLVVETRSRLRDGTVTFTSRMVWEKENPSARVEDDVKPGRPSHGTTITIEDLEPAQLTLVTGKQLQKYLSKTCMGLLRATRSRVEIIDHGERLRVRAGQYKGTLMNQLRKFPVKGFSPMELELYVLPPAGEVEIKTIIMKVSEKAYDDVTDIPQFDKPPWSTGKVCGFINFPDGKITPNRDGFVNDPAMDAFVNAMELVTAEVDEFVKDLEDARRTEVHSQFAKLFEQKWSSILQELGEVWQRPGTGEDVVTPTGVDNPPPSPEAPPQPQPVEYSDGVIAAVEITPQEPIVAYHMGLKLSARPLDEYGNIINPDRKGEIKYEWEIQGVQFGALRECAGKQVQFAAKSVTGTATVRVTAIDNGILRTATSLIYVVANVEEQDRKKRAKSGQPPPVPVWDHLDPAIHSTFNKEQNQVVINVDNQDYKDAVAAGVSAVVRYEQQLIAKEITLDRWKQLGDVNELAERLVELLSIIERVFKFEDLGMKKRGRPLTKIRHKTTK